ANETAAVSDWHLPQAHDLESWGDSLAWDGTAGITQPLIEPLWGGKTASEVLALVLDDDVTAGYDIVRRTFEETTGAADLEARWRRTLHDGLLDGSAWANEIPSVGPGRWMREMARHEIAGLGWEEGELEIVFRPDPKILDGRFANNGWLQELPESISKVTWDNPALIAPSTAETLGVTTGDVIRVVHDDRELELPVYIAPGQAPRSITLTYGYGRRTGGRVCDGVGFDVYRVRTSDGMHAGRCTVETTGRRYELAITQDHHAIDVLGTRERETRSHELIREVDAFEYLEDPEHAMHHHGEHPEAQLWPEYEYDSNAWAMSIDLNACVGCNACSSACQAENNTP
ncbi:MAG: molybdopterin oxidoreductase, partial [Acidobacteriota bacterium]|nr:molybdopterin oxidoreductase [Acidobacteriota bacterium]